MPVDSVIALERRSPIDRLLCVFAEVRAGEGLSAILLTINLFFLLTSYLIIKTVREALILSEGGAEVKSYAAAGQAILLLLVIPAYAYVSSKINRIKLINAVGLFFISNLILFYVLSRIQVPLGVTFFLWVGIFNVFIIAQFWSFANDIYTEDQGKRLFAIVAFGGSLGAIFGPKVAGALFEPLGPYLLMLVTAALLAVCLIFPNIVNRMEQIDGSNKTAANGAQPLPKGGAFRLVIGKPYLLLIALLIVLSNVVNTTGEFILGKTITEEAKRSVSSSSATSSTDAPGAPAEEKATKVRDYIGRFYGDFFFTVNLLAAATQLFLVSRIIGYCGVPGALYFLPVIALAGYSLISLIPALGLIRGVKIIENSTDYSLQNTARQALFLPTTREEKYKAKAAIDTFFVRSGDVLSAIVVFLSVQFSLTFQVLSLVNVVLISLWLLIVIRIRRRYRGLTAKRTSAGKAEI
jgi:AAA family ATP:ADP antiporter